MNLSEQTRGFTEDYWCPADGGEDPGTAVTAKPLLDGALWVALLKLSNGDAIAPAEQDWLVAQNLVQIVDGVTRLTPQGRAALGV